MGYAADTSASGDILVIVPCGSAKIWDRDPHAGPTVARDTYSGYPFRVNRAYAEHFGQHWVILSAKYGFIAPGYFIPGPYDISFNRRASNPVTVETLRRQVREQRLDRWPVVVALGGKRYREAVAGAFAESPARIICPFAGLALGKMIRATKQAIERGRPIPPA